MPSVITVRDVLRLALPAGTEVVAGGAGLGRQVNWVATLRATLPAFAELRGGELALLSVEAALALDSRLNLATLVRRLGSAPVPVAGVVALGDIRPEDIAAAEEVRLPLLKLPASADLRDVEREITRLVTDYEAQFERRSAQLYDLLTQRSLAGQGCPACSRCWPSVPARAWPASPPTGNCGHSAVVARPGWPCKPCVPMGAA